MIDLFRALVPTYYADSLAHSLPRSLLFYNDCQYICYHLMTLSRQFQTVLPDPFKQSATFVDMIFLFRALGEEKLKVIWVKIFP